jgi:hypothetical protein
MARPRASARVSVVAAGAVVLVLGLTSCGGGQPGHRHGSRAFGWLHPASPPAGWNVARTTAGATLPYPPGYTPIKTDPGTSSVALLGGDGELDAYLNLTPTQGSETLANWSRFRPDHNRSEGDRDVRVLAAARALTFRSGHGSCVIDTYTTSRSTYREIACLVSGPRTSAVVVAAAPAALWNRHAATLQRAVSGFVP